MAGRLLFAACVSLLITLSLATADEISSVAFCTSCHGTGGSGPGETIPYISGQTKEYLSITMNEIKNKERNATLMQPILQGYDEEEIEALAEWFAKQPWKNNNNNTNQKLAEKGWAIAESCAGCHGERGGGIEEIPRISGQPAKYLFNALMEYKNELRNTDSMEEVLEMSDDDLRALAEYYAGMNGPSEYNVELEVKETGTR